jgi:hypothetical protein
MLFILAGLVAILAGMLTFWHLQDRRERADARLYKPVDRNNGRG